jgi:hypothetical protein
MLICYNCNKNITPKETIKKAKNGMIQIKAKCPDCNKWIKWMPFADSIIVKELLEKEYKKNYGQTPNIS